MGRPFEKTAAVFTPFPACRDRLIYWQLSLFLFRAADRALGLPARSEV